MFAAWSVSIIQPTTNRLCEVFIMIATSLKKAAFGKLDMRKYAKVSDFAAKGSMPIRHFNFKFDAKELDVNANHG